MSTDIGQAPPPPEAGGSERMRSWLIGVLSGMTVLATVIVGLRMASRRVTHNGYWWDDWVIVSSMCWNLVCVGVFISAMYSQGLGYHADQIDVDHVITMAQLLLAAEIMYAWNLCLTKLSVLLMFWRIFHLSNTARMYLLGAGIFVIVWAVIVTFVFLFGCVPIQKLWYPTMPGTCMHPKTAWITNLAFSVLSDALIFAFPIPQLWGARYRWTELLGLGIIFGMGLFVLFASTYHVKTLLDFDPLDSTYTLAPVVAWLEIEIAAGLVAACLPILKPIILYVMHRRHGFSHHSDHPQSSTRHQDSFDHSALYSRRSSRKSSWWPNKQFFSDSRQASDAGFTASGKGASNSDAWDWEHNVEQLTRQPELCVIENEVIAPGRRHTEEESGEEGLPENGIAITTELRRWSVAMPMQ